MSEPTLTLHAKRQVFANVFFSGITALLSDYPGHCQEKDSIQESVESLSDIYSYYETSCSVAEQEIWWHLFEKSLIKFKLEVEALS